ncbi:hypothetical protein [Mycobacterium talmoniae]|uniref:hypothetical protein n=1 Tax=Mycobacterium talmoniae TaxID=1858794 RepID=UPI001058F129|nr:MULTISPECIES: hypothetical protein [Mycobacterium]TDH56203.1 hypothetical protein E2F47_08050 [Mycobacterium eburneum]
MYSRLAAAAACAVLATACSTTTEDSSLHLTFGQSAHVTDEKGSAELTVDSLDTADPADFQQLEDASKYADKTGYYLHYTLTKVDGPQPEGIDSFYVSNGDDYLTHLTVFSPLRFTGDLNHPFDNHKFNCEPASPVDFKEAPVGQRISGCQIFLADNGAAAPARVIWDPKNRQSEMVTWTP